MQTIDLVQNLAPVILAAREIENPANTLVRFAPVRASQTVSYRMGRRRRMDQTVPIRAIDAPATPIRRPGLVDVKGDLPAVSPIVNLSEQDLTNEMIIAQQLSGLAVDWQAPIESGAAAVALTVANTFEQMRGQMFSTGEIALVAEDGAIHEVDFEVPSDNKIAITGGPWDVSDSAGARKVFSDYKAGHQQFIDSSGAPAGAVLTTQAVLDTMLAAVQVLYPQAPIGFAQLQAHLGNLRLPLPITYDRSLRNEAGVKTRIYPQGHLTFMPGEGQPVGSTELGVTQESVQQVIRGTLTAPQAPGLTIVTLGDDNPVVRAVKGAAIGMPVLRDNEDIVIMSGLVA